MGVSRSDELDFAQILPKCTVCGAVASIRESVFVLFLVVLYFWFHSVFESVGSVELFTFSL